MNEVSKWIREKKKNQNWRSMDRSENEIKPDDNGCDDDDDDDQTNDYYYYYCGVFVSRIWLGFFFRWNLIWFNKKRLERLSRDIDFNFDFGVKFLLIMDRTYGLIPHSFIHRNRSVDFHSQKKTTKVNQKKDQPNDRRTTMSKTIWRSMNEDEVVKKTQHKIEACPYDI